MIKIQYLISYLVKNNQSIYALTSTTDQEVVSNGQEKAVVADDLAGNSIYFQYCYS